MNRVTRYLWIGDIQDARTKPLGEVGITHVVTVCQDSAESNVGCGYSHFVLPDAAHDYAVFREAVDTVVAKVRSGETVFVHCHVGLSRSAMVTIAAYAAIEEVSFDEAYRVVNEARGGIAPSEPLYRSAERYSESKQ